MTLPPRRRGGINTSQTTLKAHHPSLHSPHQHQSKLPSKPSLWSPSPSSPRSWLLPLQPPSPLQSKSAPSPPSTSALISASTSATSAISTRPADACTSLPPPEPAVCFQPLIFPTKTKTNVTQSLSELISTIRSPPSDLIKARLATSSRKSFREETTRGEANYSSDPRCSGDAKWFVYPGVPDLSVTPVNGPPGSTHNYEDQFSSYRCVWVLLL